MIKLVLLDFDDTLQQGTVPSVLAEYKDMDDKFHLAITEEDGKKILKENDTLYTIFKAILDTHNGKPDTHKIDEKEYWSAYSEIAGTHDDLTSVTDGARDLIAYCRAHDLKLGIVTNRDRLSLLRLLKKHQLENWDVIVTIDDVKNQKPHSEPITRAIELAHVSPDETIMIGDSPNSDIVSAKFAGVKSILFGERTPLEDAPPTYHIHHMKDAIEIIKQLSAH